MRPGTEANGHYQNYAEYSKSLRSWLVAYGVGGPVLFLTNAGIYQRVASSKFPTTVVVLFLAGVALQILLSVLNKWAAWHMYRGAFEEAYQLTSTYRFWHAVNNLPWIDFLIDLLSLVMFTVATGIVVTLFLLPGEVQ